MAPTPKDVSSENGSVKKEGGTQKALLQVSFGNEDDPGAGHITMVTQSTTSAQEKSAEIIANDYGNYFNNKDFVTVSFQPGKLYGENGYVKIEEENTPVGAKHDPVTVSSPKVAHAVEEAAERIFADGKMTQGEAELMEHLVSSIKSLAPITHLISDSTFDPKDEDKIIAEAAKIAPAVGHDAGKNSKSK